MGNNSNDNHSTAIKVAIIAVFGAIIVALISNIDKIFPRNEVPNNIESIVEAQPSKEVIKRFSENQICDFLKIVMGSLDNNFSELIHKEKDREEGDFIEYFSSQTYLNYPQEVTNDLVEHSYYYSVELYRGNERQKAIGICEHHITLVASCYGNDIKQRTAGDETARAVFHELVREDKKVSVEFFQYLTGDKNIVVVLNFEKINSTTE